MYLKLTPPLFSEVLSFNCRQLLVSCLAGTVIVGSGSVLVFNNSISSKLKDAIKPALEQLAVTSFGKGIYALGNTIGEWGSSVVGKKDDFQQWFQTFFNIDGIKSGTANLYEKLVAWGRIVYNWFATKFIEFIKNIPKMVQEWDKLRLSLFKWGTFLGGGGGQAFWAMFGNSANWSKLGDLMGHPKFEEMMNDFNTLVQKNPDAFEDLGADGIEEILEQYLEDPDKAYEAAQELIKDQEEKKKKAEEEEKKPENQEKTEEEKEKDKQLTAEEIKQKFKPSKTGQPTTVVGVFSNTVNAGLQGLLSPSFSFETLKNTAKKAMEKYIKDLEADVSEEKKRPSKKPSAKAEFLKIIEQEKDKLIEYLADAAEKAYQRSKEAKIETLTEKFIEALTMPCDGEDCDADGLVNALSNK